MVLSKEDLLAKINERIGEDASDEALSLIEDVTDTLSDFESRVGTNTEDEWKKKYDELDATWRKKYKDRFFKTDEYENDEKDEKDEKEEQTENVTIDDLFTESEE